MFDRTNTAIFPIIVERVPTGALAEGNLGRDTGRSRSEEFLSSGSAGLALDVPLVEVQLRPLVLL